MTRTLIFPSLLLLGTSVFGTPAFADANQGEYLSFTLGQKYSVPRGSVGKSHITGAMMYAVNPEDRHQHIGSLSLYVSPESSIIGSIFGGWYFSNEQSAKLFAEQYVQSLQKQYGHWKHRRSSLTNGEYQMWVDVEQRPPIVDHWPSRKKFRVSVALIYAPESESRSDWQALLQTELSGMELSAGT